MQNIKEHLTSVISQIIAMELENENLKKENEKLLKSFDTDTHILVEKGVLSGIADKMDTIESDADSSINYCETIADEVENAKYYADECSSGAYNLRDLLRDLLAEATLKQKEGENDEK